MSMGGASNEQPDAVPPAFDEQGVDRTLIREMLQLTPVERLQRLEDFVASILVIRALNGPSALP